MSATSSGVVQFFHGSVPAGAVPPPAGMRAVHASRLAADATGRQRARAQAVGLVHDAVSAALAGDEALCGLRQRQLLALCGDHPHAAWAARQEVVRTLSVDIVVRHLRGCDRRRRLQREIEQLAAALRQIAAPAHA